MLSFVDNKAKYKRLITAISAAALTVFLGQAALASENAPIMPDDVGTQAVITQTNAETLKTSFTMFTSDRMNFRKYADMNAGIMAVLDVGTEVLVVGYAENDANREWALVDVNGSRGYVKNEYLTETKPVVRAKAELLTWAEVKSFLPLGVNLPVLDLYTGLTYNVRSFSNGAHADVEPVTKDDTAVMKRTYGGVWDWDGRPVVVTIAGRRVVAAINGMPHGGGVNGGNGMNGQVCLHFKGSHVHNGNTAYERTLQNAVIRAWEMSQ